MNGLILTLRKIRAFLSFTPVPTVISFIYQKYLCYYCVSSIHRNFETGIPLTKRHKQTEFKEQLENKFSTEIVVHQDYSKPKTRGREPFHVGRPH
jgi:hypothetical protein